MSAALLIRLLIAAALKCFSSLYQSDTSEFILISVSPRLHHCCVESRRDQSLDQLMVSVNSLLLCRWHPVILFCQPQHWQPLLPQWILIWRCHMSKLLQSYFLHLRNVDQSAAFIKFECKEPSSPSVMWTCAALWGFPGLTVWKRVDFLCRWSRLHSDSVSLLCVSILCYVLA